MKYTWMFIAGLFIISKSWKPARCPSADECINKLWDIRQWSIIQLQKEMGYEVTKREGEFYMPITN